MAPADYGPKKDVGIYHVLKLLFSISKCYLINFLIFANLLNQLQLFVTNIPNQLILINQHPSQLNLPNQLIQLPIQLIYFLVNFFNKLVKLFNLVNLVNLFNLINLVNLVNLFNLVNLVNLFN